MKINKNKIEILKFLFTKEVDLSSCLTRAIGGLIYETYFEKDEDVLDSLESLLELKLIEIIDDKETDSLSTKLNLKSKNTNMDWDLEFSDYHRIEEFIDFFNKEKLTDDEKFLLIAIIFASFDDELVKEGNITIKSYRLFTKILRENYELCLPILNYWLPDKDHYSLGYYLQKYVSRKKK